MPHGDIETFHLDGAWHNRVEGATEVFGPYDRKEDAIAEGRDRAQDTKVEHIIRNLDGTIGERSTHGHDPREIRG